MPGQVNKAQSGNAAGAVPAIKLNLGCGQRLLAGYVNVDMFGEPDLRWNLEQFPWPWPDNAVGEVEMSHVLEHLGAGSDVFIRIMQELYRVCRAGAIVRVTVPHPRHDTFLADPTHVRPISPLLFSLFSKKLNAVGGAGPCQQPLRAVSVVDFELESSPMYGGGVSQQIARAGMVRPSAAAVLRTLICCAKLSCSCEW